MKTLLTLALSLLATTAARADLKLSPAEVAAKKLTICRNLQGSIENVSQLSNHHSLEPSAEDASFFSRMQAELLANFKQLQCESRLDQAAADHASLVASCKKLNAEFVANRDRSLDLQVAGLQGKGNDKKVNELEARNEALSRQYQRMGCMRVTREKKAE